MRLNRGSLGNLLQDEASCAIYPLLLRRRSTNKTERVDVQPTKRSEWTFNQQNGTSGGNGRRRRVAVILRHDVSFGVRGGGRGSGRHDRSTPDPRHGKFGELRDIWITRLLAGGTRQL